MNSNAAYLREKELKYIIMFNHLAFQSCSDYGPADFVDWTEKKHCMALEDHQCFEMATAVEVEALDIRFAAEPELVVILTREEKNGTH